MTVSARLGRVCRCVCTIHRHAGQSGCVCVSVCLSIDTDAQTRTDPEQTRSESTELCTCSKISYRSSHQCRRWTARPAKVANECSTQRSTSTLARNDDSSSNTELYACAEAAQRSTPAENGWPDWNRPSARRASSRVKSSDPVAVKNRPERNAQPQNPPAWHGTAGEEWSTRQRGSILHDSLRGTRSPVEPVPSPPDLPRATRSPGVELHCKTRELVHHDDWSKALQCKANR